MALAKLDGVGFCAHYSEAGDWAFDYALALSRRWSVPLNVFHFLSDPYDPPSIIADQLSTVERAKLAVQRERELRLYYDERAGDYLEVGFRLCDDRAWKELHHCLRVREFQVLALGYVAPSATFAGHPVEQFANAFVCPVVLVGPTTRDELRFNPQAALVADKLVMPPFRWLLVEGASTSC